MLWAACCVFFFLVFLRLGELTAPECGEFDPGQHLSYADIAVDNRSDPKVVSIRIKQSKTDPFRQGVTIFLGRTDGMVCPVAALMSYLAVRGPGGGPLFRYQDGSQFQNRCGDNYRSVRSAIGCDQDAGSLEKSSLPAVHTFAKESASSYQQDLVESRHMTSRLILSSSI